MAETKPAHRPWRGMSGTLADYIFWLGTWKRIFLALAAAPTHRYYKELLALPAYLDEQLAFLRGKALRAAHERLRTETAELLCQFQRKKFFYCGEGVPEELTAGFPALGVIHTHSILPASESAAALVFSPAEAPVTERFVFGAAPDAKTFTEYVRFMEATCGEKLDFDALFAYLERQNRQSRICPALDILSGTGRRFRRALIWACPHDCRAGFYFWLEQQWDIVCVMDRESYISGSKIDLRSARSALEGMIARLRKAADCHFQSTSEIRKAAEECGADLIIVFSREETPDSGILYLSAQSQGEMRRQFAEHMENMRCHI